MAIKNFSVFLIILEVEVSLVFKMSFPMKVPTPSPPAKGSFPLDHKGQCRYEMLKYMLCLNEHEVWFSTFIFSNLWKEPWNISNSYHCCDISFQQKNDECRNFAKIYLKCRMDNGLMQQEDWSYLGFSDKDET